MRSLAVLVLLAAVQFPVLVTPSAAADNPHNLGDCSSCHPSTPRFGSDSRRNVAFTTTADDPGLCATCHPAAEHRHPVLVAAGSGPAGARSSSSLPPGTSAAVAGKIVCTSCHFVHASDTRYGLLRGFPGSPDPGLFASAAAFCGECHGANLERRSAHAGGERSCAFCHAGAPRRESWVEAPSGLTDRCEICHRGVKDDHFAKITPFGKERECLLCHDPHGVAAASAGLLSEQYRAAAADSVVIRPHYRRSLCFTCHANLDDFALRDDDVNALCDRCHASGAIPANIHPLRKVPATITVPKGWPLTDGALTCLTCHDQGHEDQPPQRWMLHGGPYALSRAACRNCHTSKDLEVSRMHQEINEGKSCEMCHRTRPRPGVDTVKTVTFIADPDLLCLRCHDQSASDPSVHHSGVVGREVGEGHLQEQLPLFRGRVICATCHNPHMLDASGIRLRVSIQNSELCLGCHEE